MRTTTLRLLAFCAMAAAGSCAITPDRDPGMLTTDGAANHPIMVEPSFQAMRLDFSAGSLSPAALNQLDAFVTGYAARGTGAISVSAPASANARGMIDFVAGRINALGISRERILVATHDAPAGDMRVDVNYVTHVARTSRCGDWSDDLAFTAMNATPRNFGCAVQHNLAANLADPRDLMGPRTMDPSSGARRATVMGLYEQGKPTQQEKKTVDVSVEQSAAGSANGN